MTKTSILALFSLLFMIFHADLVTKGAAAGLLLWYSAVVPALFPFMVLSSVLSGSGGISRLMQPFTAVFRFCGLIGRRMVCSPHRAPLRLSYGGKNVCGLSRGGRLSSSEAKFLFALCNHPSPMFLAGFVYPMFAAQLPLLCFVFAIYMPLLLLAIPAHFIYHAPFSPESIPENSGISQQHPTLNSANAFSSKHTRSDKSSSSALSLVPRS